MAFDAGAPISLAPAFARNHAVREEMESEEENRDLLSKEKWTIWVGSSPLHPVQKIETTKTTFYELMIRICGLPVGKESGWKKTSADSASLYTATTLQLMRLCTCRSSPWASSSLARPPDWMSSNA